MLGALAHAASRAPTRRDALDVIAHYAFVWSDRLHIRVVDEDDTTMLIIEHALHDVDHGHGADAALMLAVRMGRELIGDDGALLGVHVEHPPHGDVNVYREAFGVDVEFEQAHNAVLFERQQLKMPTAQPDPLLFSTIKAHLDDVGVRLRQTTSSSTPSALQRIRAAAADNAAHGEYGGAALAKAVGMSLRTLQRTLAKDDLTVRVVVDEVREQQAKELLQDDRLSVEEVACILGYSDDRAFRRAFARMTGTSPAQHRKQSHFCLAVSFLCGWRIAKCVFVDGLTGPIPYQLATLTGLKRLRLHANQLTGSYDCSHF